MKTKGFLSVTLALLFLSSLSLANGLNLNGLGARATAMGGAFVGLADDYSAIFWNPAGMTNFSTKYFGFHGEDIIPSGTYKFVVPPPFGTGTPLVNTETSAKHYLGGMAAFYYPINKNLVAGISVYTPSGLGAKWPTADMAAISNLRTDMEWMSFVGVVSISPALAYKISDAFSIGVAMNINYGMFDVKMYAGEATVGPPLFPVVTTLDFGQYEESMTGWGYGATIGILVKPSPKFSFGLTYKTASTIKFEGEAKISGLSVLVPFGIKASSTLSRDVTWPMWIGAGIAFKPTDKLTLTADVQYTNWKKIDTIQTSYDDTIWKNVLMADEATRYMHWKDATQIRFGAEYKVSKALAVRAGYYTDPSPAPDTTLNILLPSYDFNNISFGLGYALNGLQIDFGFEYLMGKERDVSFDKVILDPEYEHAQPGTYGMKIIVPFIAIGYKF
ncbi:MAG: outer membrane protein transport protein [Candidatus Aminicenantales bacterium]